MVIMKTISPFLWSKREYKEIHSLQYVCWVQCKGRDVDESQEMLLRQIIASACLGVCKCDRERSKECGLWATNK